MGELSASVVFLNYNRLAETKVTVGELLRCREELGDLEIIAVDNGSTDGTAEYLMGLDGRVTPLLLDRNYGIEGYNRGFERARGDIIVVLDDDSHVGSDCIARAGHILAAEPGIGVVAFKIVDKEGRRFSTWHLPSTDLFQDSFAFVGCGFAVRRSLFEDIGYYPGNFFLYHNEVHVAINVKLKGYRVVYDPQCVAVHRTEGKPRDPSRRIYYTLRNSLILIWLYYPLPSALYLSLSRFIISSAVAACHFRWGVVTSALVDFIREGPQRRPLSRRDRTLLKPFFRQNSILHRLLPFTHAAG